MRDSARDSLPPLSAAANFTSGRGERCNKTKTFDGPKRETGRKRGRDCSLLVGAVRARESGVQGHAAWSSRRGGRDGRVGKGYEITGR